MPVPDGQYRGFEDGLSFISRAIRRHSILLQCWPKTELAENINIIKMFLLAFPVKIVINTEKNAKEMGLTETFRQC